jgi:hypothetical protein
MIILHINIITKNRTGKSRVLAFKGTEAGSAKMITNNQMLDKSIH